jgi:predicted nucleic acid-binding protein
MIVVSDTSPLNYLVLIGHVDVLPALFDRVVTPPAVVAELLHPGSPTPVHVWASSLPEWLEVVTPASTDHTLGLAAGEAEAIAVAQELAASLLLVDERKASSVAARLGIQAVGTLNVLALAAERGLLELSSAIAGLRGTTFREPTALVEELLRRDAERRRRS